MGEKKSNERKREREMEETAKTKGETGRSAETEAKLLAKNQRIKGKS